MNYINRLITASLIENPYLLTFLKPFAEDFFDYYAWNQRNILIRQIEQAKRHNGKEYEDKCRQFKQFEEAWKFWKMVGEVVCGQRDEQTGEICLNTTSFIEHANELYHKRKNKAIYDVLTETSKRAVPLSYYYLGEIYLRGIYPAEKDFVAAADNFYFAADKGVSAAAERMGYMYYYGLIGIEADYKRAFEWYEQSAYAGNAAAQERCAYMLLNGFGGIENDNVLARKYAEAAAAKGNKKAQELLIYIYDTNGEEEKADNIFLDYLNSLRCQEQKESAIFFRAIHKAVSAENSAAIKKLLRNKTYKAKKGEIYAQKDLLHLYLTEQKLFKPKRRLSKILFWSEKLCEHSSFAQYVYGYMLYFGIGTEHNEARGIECLKKSAEKGHNSAIRLLRELKD